MSEEKIKLKDVCTSSDKLSDYLSQKAAKHNYYKYYTTAERLETWKATHSIYLTTGRKWNDKTDREQFNCAAYDYVNFGLCFSFSISENIAMWMLYGGMKRDGVMIDFQRQHIREIIGNTSQITLGRWDNDEFVASATLSRDDFRIELIDILYISDKNEKGCYDIKRSNEAAKDVAPHIVDDLESVKKSYPWCYENECRLVIQVKRRVLDDPGIDTARISLQDDFFDELAAGSRIIAAPNTASNTKYSKSKLTNKIDWDLCAKCSSTASQAR